MLHNAGGTNYELSSSFALDIHHRIESHQISLPSPYVTFHQFPPRTIHSHSFHHTRPPSKHHDVWLHKCHATTPTHTMIFTLNNLPHQTTSKSYVHAIQVFNIGIITIHHSHIHYTPTYKSYTIYLQTTMSIISRSQTYF